MSETSEHNHTDPLLSAAEVVQEFPDSGLTRNTLWRWARSGLLECVRYPSGRVRFRKSAIEALLRPSVASPDDSASMPPSADSPPPGQPVLSWPSPARTDHATASAGSTSSELPGQDKLPW
ncbi:helix-turn-helix domain-containing protein [Actinomyces sp. 432]|uniref:helix-turn-helix domain-containing protein n=1 Tax=Actinomyces sp. 432 TaxID=2057798 RepID=UPI0013793F32